MSRLIFEHRKRIPPPIPWSVLSQFAAGPTLSRADALLAHDTLAPAAAPARLENP